MMWQCYDNVYTFVHDQPANTSKGEEGIEDFMIILRYGVIWKYIQNMLLIVCSRFHDVTKTPIPHTEWCEYKSTEEIMLIISSRFHDETRSTRDVISTICDVVDFM